MQKGQGLILVLIGILVIMVVASGAFYLGRSTARQPQSKSSFVTSSSQQTPSPIVDETANWKTYTNTKIGFKIKYPPRYPIPVLPSGRADAPTIYADGTEDNAFVIFGTTTLDAIYLRIIPFKGAVEEFYNNLTLTYELDPNYVIIPQYHEMKFVKELAVANQKALWYERVLRKEQFGFQEVYFVFNNHGFVLQPSKINKKQDKKEIEMMLSFFAAL